MLQQIQFHVHEDEQTQQQIEKTMALQIRENYRHSIGAIERYIPPLAELAKKTDSAVSTLLCNKYSELNIVNYNSGQVLYGMHPKAEVLTHFCEYMSKAPKIEIQSSDVNSSEALVCFGLGLGYHLEHIVNEGLYKHVVVYEPNVDYFICALSSLSWKSLLQKAKDKGIVLYMQIGADGTSFSKDMQELVSHIKIDTLLFYKHLHTPVFSEIEQKVHTATWAELYNWFVSSNKLSLSESFLPLWAPLKNDEQHSVAFLNEERKAANLSTLEKYFPDVYKEFKDYTPERWAPIANASGEVFLFHKSTNALFSGESVRDARTSYERFASKPHKDGLLLSYKGKKLKGYLHYQLVEECERLFDGLKEAQSELPEKVKSLIQFGIGSGYSLESLVENHDIGMLFVCEPNRDFFYASLYAIDWSQIISSFDRGQKRLYLNIGDDGTNLTRDLLVQFQSVGPYILANTFFYQSYVNEKLTDAVAQLREQLLVIVAMGDYFDNAKYGLAHTKWALENNIPFLKKNTKDLLPVDVLDVPVFIVGNGPSLDNLMNILKEESDKAIVISCGTALQALHRNGICPDFHAEIETNRSTFDWLKRIDDEAFLKRITLLSCNGVHPDAATLFGETLLAFKQGEASTVAFTELDKEHGFATLDFSYPTVTNFASDLVTTIGFTQVYLFGTDMGFVSDSYHHSKSSGYYDGKGNELYDYSANHAMSLTIQGNFKPWVKTKYEFKVSKSVLEQVFTSRDSEVYNLNDGARIFGAKPLRAENILVVSTQETKKRAKSLLSETAFTYEKNQWFVEEFASYYSSERLIEELTALCDVVNVTFDSISDIDDFIVKQRDFIVSSFHRKKSLAFYYLNGTFNYINSIFSKLLNIADDVLAIDAANSLVQTWSAYVRDILAIISNDQYGLDAISSLSGVRRQKVLSKFFNETTFNLSFVPCKQVTASPLMNLLANSQGETTRDISINWLSKGASFKSEQAFCNVSLNVNEFDDKPIQGITVLSPGNFENSSEPLQANDTSRLDLALIAMVSGLNNVIFLQKYTQHPSLDIEFLKQFEKIGKGRFSYGGPDFIVVSDVPISEKDLILPSGDRLILMPRIKAIDLRREYIDEAEYAQRMSAKLKQVGVSKGE